MNIFVSILGGLILSILWILLSFKDLIANNFATLTISYMFLGAWILFSGVLWLSVRLQK